VWREIKIRQCRIPRSLTARPPDVILLFRLCSDLHGHYQHGLLIISLELKIVTHTSAVPTNVDTVKCFTTKRPMKMMNANTNRDEDNKSGAWKQVGSGKATGTDRDNKTDNGNKKDDGMTSYKVKAGIIEVRFMTASGKSCNIARSLK
jgi:hypothetical protein